MKPIFKIILLSIILHTNLNCFAADDFTHTLELAKYSAKNKSCSESEQHTKYKFRYLS